MFGVGSAVDCFGRFWRTVRASLCSLFAQVANRRDGFLLVAKGEKRFAAFPRGCCCVSMGVHPFVVEIGGWICEGVRELLSFSLMVCAAKLLNEIVVFAFVFR